MLFRGDTAVSLQALSTPFLAVGATSDKPAMLERHVYTIDINQYTVRPPLHSNPVYSLKLKDFDGRTDRWTETTARIAQFNGIFLEDRRTILPRHAGARLPDNTTIQTTKNGTTNPLKLEAVWLSEMLVPNHKTTQYHSQADH